MEDVSGLALPGTTVALTFKTEHDAGDSYKNRCNGHEDPEPGLALPANTYPALKTLVVKLGSTLSPSRETTYKKQPWPYQLIQREGLGLSAAPSADWYAPRRR
jgi:hypothetical protein